MDTCDRFLGCMLGGATGDALGYIIEFDDWYTIRKKFGLMGCGQYCCVWMQMEEKASSRMIHKCLFHC